MVSITAVGLVFAATVFISKKYYIRTTMGMQSWGFGSSWLVTLTGLAMLPIFFGYSMWWQILYLGYGWAIKSGGALLFCYFGHYLCVLALQLAVPPCRRRRAFASPLVAPCACGGPQVDDVATLTPVRRTFRDVRGGVPPLLAHRDVAEPGEHQQHQAALHEVLQPRRILDATPRGVEGAWPSESRGLVPSMRVC